MFGVCVVEEGLEYVLYEKVCKGVCDVCELTN